MLRHFQEKLHNQENLVFGWCQRGFELYETPQTEVTLCCFWKARSECLMSSKRKEKKIKGTDTVPLPPPTEKANFSYTPQKYSKDQSCRHSQSPRKSLWKPLSPTENLVHSGEGGTGSGYLNGIDQNSFMVRGITNLIVLVSLKKTTATATTQIIVAG